jgi:recombinational DNA repair protein RecT
MTTKSKANLVQEDQNHIRKTAAMGATDDEFKTFMYLCNMYNLDPLKKEIYFIKYGGKSTIITSRDGYLKIANCNEHFDGIESDVVYQGDLLTKRDDGSLLITYGQEHLSFDKSKLSGAFL